jgi:hypothetical protein
MLRPCPHQPGRHEFFREGRFAAPSLVSLLLIASVYLSLGGKRFFGKAQLDE